MARTRTNMLILSQSIQQQLRQEIRAVITDESESPAYSVLQTLPLLTSVIYESLRMYPPISQLINRCTTTATNLGSTIHIPAGTYMGYNAYSTNRDPGFWGADADEFNPFRWGKTIDEINALFRRANAKGAFISFHGGRRACLGQKFAMFEARVAMCELLREVEWEVDPTWVRKMTPVSVHADSRAVAGLQPCLG
jgi:cytochrome P450